LHGLDEPSAAAGSAKQFLPESLVMFESLRLLCGSNRKYDRRISLANVGFDLSNITNDSGRNSDRREMIHQKHLGLCQSLLVTAN
jgi:hypothetical protein